MFRQWRLVTSRWWQMYRTTICVCVYMHGVKFEYIKTPISLSSHDNHSNRSSNSVIQPMGYFASIKERSTLKLVSICLADQLMISPLLVALFSLPHGVAICKYVVPSLSTRWRHIKYTFNFELMFIIYFLVSNDSFEFLNYKYIFLVVSFSSITLNFYEVVDIVIYICI